MKARVVFISYSWDNEDHKEWVLRLAGDIIGNGVDVVLDQYDLSAGKEMTHFMEKGMLADKVLVILTPNYKLKGDKREGGVGYEYSLLTKELYDSAPDQTRIIPVLRLGDAQTSAPSFLATRIYHDMRNDLVYDARLFELIKLIQDKPLVQKPELGKPPTFNEGIAPDIEKTVKDFKKKEEFITKKKGIIGSPAGARLFIENTNSIIKQINESLDNLKKNFNLHTYRKTDDQRPSITYTTVYFTAHFGAELRFGNTADEAYIKMNLFKGPVGFNEMAFDYWEQPEQIYSHKYFFDLDESLQPIFVKDGAPDIRLKAYDIASASVRDLVSRELKRQEEGL